MLQKQDCHEITYSVVQIIWDTCELRRHFQHF